MKTAELAKIKRAVLIERSRRATSTTDAYFIQSVISSWENNDLGSYAINLLKEKYNI